MHETLTIQVINYSSRITVFQAAALLIIISDLIFSQAFRAIL